MSECQSTRRYQYAVAIATDREIDGLLSASEEKDFWTRFFQRFLCKIDSSDPDGCWEWRGAFNRSSAKLEGYWPRGDRPRFNFISIMPGRKRRTLAVYAYRMALWLRDPSHPLRGTEWEACHTCNNRRCCRPDHLIWGTAEQNRDHRYRKDDLQQTAA